MINTEHDLAFADFDGTFERLLDEAARIGFLISFGRVLRRTSSVPGWHSELEAESRDSEGAAALPTHAL